MVPDASSASSDEPLRMALVRYLQQQERMQAKSIIDAFAEVPRHLFLPNVPLERAYADEAVVTKWSPMHQPLSSASQPSMIALMLEQLDVQSGMHVLEIGAGTGYNAALLSHIVGPGGHVTTIDIDADIVATAQAHLTAAEYPPERVTVICGDGAAGWAAAAPYDRIMLTAGAWDVAPAWMAQLKDGGRIVLPLAVRTTQTSMALDRVGDAFCSVSLRSCGFIRLRGPFTGPEAFLLLSDTPSLKVLVEPPLPHTETLASLLATSPRMLSLPVTQADGLRFTIALTEPHTATLLATPPHPLLGQTALGIITPEGDSACFIGSDGQSTRSRVEYGAATAGLAMERAIARWHALGEPTLDDWQLRLAPISAYQEESQNGHIWVQKAHWWLEAWVAKQA